MLFRLSLRLIAICGLVCLAPHLRAQAPDTLRIQVLSGKTGRPVVNTHIALYRSAKLEVFDSGPHGKGEMTDGEGYVTLPGTDAATLFARVDTHIACAKEPQTFSLAGVRAKGVVSDNTCSKRIKLFPQPGTLVLFVRDLTFFEKMRR